MHETQFANSFQPPLTKVFGVPLDTYAIGHELALIGQGNPLATYGPASFDELDITAKKLALVLAVEICGRFNLIGKYLFVARVHHADANSLDGQIQMFRAYRAAGSLDLPLTKMPRQQGVPFRYYGAPALASLINYVTEKHSLLIQSHFKGSPLNFPLGLAQILYTTQMESAGQVWVKNSQEMERELPPKEGTPPPGLNEKVLTGDEAEKAFAEAVAKANQGTT